MSEIKTHWAEVDAQGRLVLEPDVAARYGLRPGARVRLDLDSNTVRMHRPVTHLGAQGAHHLELRRPARVHHAPCRGR